MSDRKFLRYKPDENEIALIDLKSSSKDFKPSITALILNESYSGCAILFANNVTVKKEAKVKIKIGNLHVMKGEVVWVKILEENIQKVGIKIIES